MELPALAAAALATASAAHPAVTRTFIAGGPAFARTCELIAVYGSLVTPEGAGPAGVNQSPLFPGGCGLMVVPQVTVVYAKDCYPMPDDQHRPPSLPDPADLTAWSTDFLTHCQAIIDAVLDAHMAGTFGDCAVSTVGPVLFTGPSSGVATMQVPITVRS